MLEFIRTEEAMERRVLLSSEAPRLQLLSTYNKNRSSTKIRTRRRPNASKMVLTLLVAMAVMDLKARETLPEARFCRFSMVMGFPSSLPGRRLSRHDGNFGLTSASGYVGGRLSTERIPAIIMGQRKGLRIGMDRHKNRGIGALASSSQSLREDTDRTSKRLKAKRLLVRLLTGERASSLQKPKWLSKSSKLFKILPTWIFHLRPSVQLLVTLFVYLFHTMYLSQTSILLPFQLLPNDRGYFSSIGLDTLAGIGTLVFYQNLRDKPSNFFGFELQESSKTIEKVPANITSAILTNETAKNTTIITTRTTTTDIKASFLPDLMSTPNPKSMPWKSIWKSNYSKFSSLLALLALTRAYFFTGRCSLFWEDKLYEMALHWKWMTVPMHRSLSVLLGHLSWVAMGGLILRWIPRPQPFFQEPKSQWFMSRYRKKEIEEEDFRFSEEEITPEQLLDTSPSRHPQWVWWAIGGYFVSSWFFSITDFCIQYIFPVSVLEMAEETSIVAKIANPENKDIWAAIVGYIAPCITAPWWEEVLYRGFLLPTLVLQFRYPMALFLSGILFSAHHQSELAFLPLCVLGWTWAIIYTKSKNLWTTMLIHWMWNSRIFLGSWFGL